MTYSYFIDNTNAAVSVDNSKLFKYLQIIQLPEDNIVTEQAGERIEIQKLFDSFEKEDVLIVRSVQDLGDNITQVLRVMQWLSDNQVDLISICEDYYNSTDYAKLIADLYSFDCDLRKKARLVGYDKALVANKVGRPRNEGIDEALRLYDTKRFTAEQICKISSISQSTLYRALRDRQSKIQNN